MILHHPNVTRTENQTPDVCMTLIFDVEMVLWYGLEHSASEDYALERLC